MILSNEKLTVGLVFVILLLTSCDYGNGYRVEGNKVVYERPWNTGFGTQVINVEADSKSFEELGGNNMKWARDKNHVFNEHHILDFLNPDSFVLLSQDFGKDSSSVVCETTLIPEADVATFKVKTFKDREGNKEELGVDNHAAYDCYDGGYSYMPVKSIDTFEQLYRQFYRDEFDVYWWGNRLPLNINNLKLLKGSYIPVDEHVFYVLLGIDKRRTAHLF